MKVLQNSPDLYGDSQMCNGKVVSRLQSQGNQVFMRLTIVNTERASFKIRYEQLASGCGGYMSGFAGALSAPQYPHSDSRFINCEWQIAVALVKLQFIKIDNLDSADRSGLCAPFARNFIEVTTSSSPDAHVLKRYCRSEASPDAISSDTNQMFVRYGQNGGSINGGLYGFLAQYTSVCENVELNNTHGSIQSPGYPFRISEARDCNWKIDTTPGSYIKVVFHKFNIKDTSYLRIGNRQLECMSNYLEIDPTQINRTTGMTDSKPSNDLKIYKFCDRAAEPTIIYSKSNTLELKFKSTADRPENHFWLSWSTIGCGAHILQNGTTISALDSHFVNVSISPQRECLWVAKAPIGYVVQVDINHLFTTGSVQENDASVCVPSKFSGLEFFYGTQPSNYVQKEMCGAISKQKYISFSNELTIRLRFDGRNQNSQNGSIFRASVTFVQPALNKSCGGVIKVRPGVNETLHSPNYPKAYPRAVECVWQFETQKGYTISYNLSRYDTPNQHAKRTVGTLTRPSQNTRCSYGLGYIEGNVAFYASAYNRSKFEVNIDYYKSTCSQGRLQLQRICVDIAEPIIVQTLVNVSAVTFNGAPYEASVPSGDIKVTTPIGFQLEAFAVCGGTLYASSTRQVFKLGGLFMEKQSKECELLIERDETASSYQSDLSAPIYARFELQANNMKVQNETDITINVRCGSTENKIVITHTDDIDHAEEIRQIKCDTALTVTVPPFDAGKSLVITYDTEMKFCGAQFGAIKGIVNMGDLKEDIECEWLFSLFDGNSVEIQIGPSYLNPSPYCAQSYIELRADNKSGPLLGRHCGKISPFKLKAGKVYMRLRQVLDKPEDDDYVPEYETSDEEPGEKPHFLFSYKYHLGGYTQSKKIVMFWRSTDYIDLTNPNNARISWMLSAKNPDNYIRVHISSKFDVDIVILDYHCPTPCLDPYYPNGVRQIDEERADVHNKVYLIKSNIATILATEIVSSSAFEIDWDEVPALEVNKTLALEETTRESDFTCGGELTATYQPQKLVLPTNIYGEYELDMRCRWKLRRPMFSGITFTIKRLDLEDHEECLYDYVTITSKEYTSLEELAQSPFTKFCHKSHVGYELTLNYDEYVYMYFVSDSSSSYSGFTIEYRLGCRTFEYIPSSIGLFDVILGELFGMTNSNQLFHLESPSYPDTSSYNYSCMWGLMLESNRDVEVVSLDMDMMPRVDGACKEDSLKIVGGFGGDFPSPLDPTRRTGEFCGKENVSFIAPSGRVYVQLEKPVNTAVHRGFRLRIHEVVHSCSSETLFVDEHTKSAVLTSPNFPHLAPNSLDCRWVLSVPAGHRLKFTVDPNNFNLQNAHDVECKDDYMEIYDGASEGAPFLGRQVSTNPKGTATKIRRRRSFLPIRTCLFASLLIILLNHMDGTLLTSWLVVEELSSCKRIKTSQSQVRTSPMPILSKKLVSGQFRPPPGHFVHAKFNHLWLYVMDNCTRDYLTLRENNSTGKVIMPQTCTYRNVNQTGYYLNGNAYLKFQSNNTVHRLTRTNCLSGKCGFDLDFSASRFECGGVITDEEGEVYLQTTSENKIIKGLRCQYDMRAGIGYRYRIEFFFVEENPDNHGYYYKTNMYGESPLNWCFPDLEIWNGPYDGRYNLFGIHMRFCQNRTTFVSSSDIVSVVYEDRSDVYNFYFSLNETRLHRPFGFKYTKVEADYDENVCMYHVTENTNITVQNMTYYTRSSQLINGAVLGQAKCEFKESFCHIRVDNPLRSATVSLNFTNFKGGRLGMNMCGIMDNKVETHIWPIRETLCSAVVKNSSAFFVYNHPLVDVFVQNNPFSYLYGYDTTIRFNLSVVFHACGGYITEDENGNAGTITSPGFNRGNYSNSVDCMWTFQAPEGKVVQLNFTYMDIEYSHECNKKDFLEVTAGEDRHSVISSYCYTKDGPEDQRLPDRYRVVKTFGRYLTMYFHSDESETRRGFSVNWEFTHFDNGTCGFTTHAQTGIIHSPNYPDDYPNNLKCMWHIVVPPGFHIKLTFDHVDIQESHQCTKDYLSISQEHQSRGQDPLNAYYFYYDHEEMLNNSCGIINLPQIDTESNQVRVNFTTDKKITGKGFKLRWKAECGTVFKTSHGVVMSPFYPRYYPNENFECNYLINPETDYEKIITVRLVDADLDTTLTSMSGDCSSDYVEIFDVAQSASLVKFCGRDQLTLSEATSVFSVRGSVGVKFVSNMSLMHDVKKKNHRGFKITYALSECGGDIELAEAHNRLAGTINSPGYPMPYFEDMDCVWNVTAPEGYIISVKFTGIDIEGTTNCTYDYVEVFDGPEMQNETSFGRLCGPRPPQGQRISKSNKMVIRFVSDSTANRAGFMAVVTATIGPKRGCGGELYASSDIKSISVPLADNGDSYMNNLRCTLEIDNKHDEDH
ncbi:putative cubilin [Aphelenchoides bicaudatus]|nr:putative cubilin [Aphelenchoides bicaudatus]